MKLARFIGFFGGLAIALGLFFHDVYAYSPMIGYIIGVVSFLIAAIIATSKKRSKPSSKGIRKYEV